MYFYFITFLFVFTSNSCAMSNLHAVTKTFPKLGLIKYILFYYNI